MNKLIEKVGVDKVLHFLVGAVIAFIIDTTMMIQEGLPVSWETLIFTIAGIIIAIIAGIIKDFIIDSKIDKKDIIATALGGLIPVISFTIGILFNIASN